MIDMGAKIQELRRKKGVTQAEMGEAIGVSSQAVSRWENQVGTPDIDSLPLIADYFGVTVDELFSHTTKMTSDKIAEALQDEIASSKDNELFEKSYLMCENIALGAVAQIKQNPEHLYRTGKYNAFALRDGGFVKMRKQDDFNFFFLLSERDGFKERVKRNADNLVAFFKVLSDKTTFEIFSFLYTRTSTPFTLDYIKKSLGISAHDAESGIGALIEANMVEKSELETAEGMIPVYSAYLDAAFLGMLIFAIDLVGQNNEYYARSRKRSKPLIH